MEWTLNDDKNFIMRGEHPMHGFGSKIFVEAPSS